jgi:hypothetical protein
MNRFLLSVGMERTTTLELQKNKESMKRIFKEVWSKGNMEVLDEVVAPTFKQHQYDRAQQPKRFPRLVESMKKDWIRTRPANRILSMRSKQVKQP